MIHIFDSSEWVKLCLCHSSLFIPGWKYKSWGHQKEPEPIYSDLYPRSDCATARNRNKRKHLPIAMFFRKQSFISLSYLDRDKNEFLIRRRLRTCYFCTLSGKLENLVSVTKCNSSSSMHSIAQMLCVEHEALTVNFGSLEGSWLKKPVHWEMGVGELMNTHFCLSNSVRCRDKEYLLFQIGWNG